MTGTLASAAQRVNKNRSLRFVCREVSLRVEAVGNPFTNLAFPGEVWHIPVKHGEGCYVADPAELDQLERDGRILLRYCRPDGSRERDEDAAREYNPNGAMRDVAGVMNAGRNVFGLMPHPEHAADESIRALAGAPGRGTDGLRIFQSIAEWVAAMSQRATAGSMPRLAAMAAIGELRRWAKGCSTQSVIRATV